MNINGIVASSGLLQSESEEKKRKRANAAVAEGADSRNTGPDTVSFSHEALDRYAAMKNGSGSTDTTQEGRQSFLQRQSYERGRATTRMDQAELLAFLRSDTFAAEAVGYTKAVATADAARDGDDDSRNKTIMALGAKTHRASTDTGNGDTDAMTVEEKAKNTSGTAFVNGKRADEKELALEIQKVKEEVDDLAAAYEHIMGSEGGLEEKLRISQPIHKRLDERLRTLQALKAQAQGLADEKNLMKTA